MINRMFSIETPLGSFELEHDENGIKSFWPASISRKQIKPSNPTSKEIEQALKDYFRGNFRKIENFSLNPSGTEFQKEVWRILRSIPPGSTLSYSEVAEKIGRPTAFRAVARACATNPVALFIPCHRVIAKNGSLSGFRGGLEMKKALLNLERSIESLDAAC